MAENTTENIKTPKIEEPEEAKRAPKVEKNEEVKKPVKTTKKAEEPKKAVKTTKKVPSVNAGTEAPVKTIPASSVDKKKAKNKRIVACILWVLAIVCEVLALMVYNGKLDLGFVSQTAQLIAFLAIDLILVIVGAQFWKNANHIDPISQANKAKFWLWNNMGVIVCCFAFIPFLIVALTDKKADPKLKKVATIAAAIALVIGTLASIDYNPVSQEGLATAEETLAGQTVYWTEYGTVYHTDLYCQHLNRTAEPYEGDVATAIANDKTRICKTCAKNAGLTVDDNGAIIKSESAPVEETSETVENAEATADAEVSDETQDTEVTEEVKPAA